ncbi:MAG: site-specific integrase [Phascolarctobacterium sp.]|nr:site-specific integrase [Phascolarctobacterium sp.]
MSIQVIKRKKGTVYRFRFTLKGTTISSEIYTDKEQCKRDEAKARAQVLDNTYIVVDKKTVAEVWDMYNKYKPVKRKTMLSRNAAFNHLTNSGMATLPISKVKPMHIEKFLLYLKGSNIAPITQRTYISKIFAFFTWAYKKQIIGTNPTGPIDLPSVRQKEARIFSKDEFFYRLSVMKEKYPHLFGAALLAGFFGLRIGEACAVNIDGSFDFDKKLLHVTEQYGYMGNGTSSFDDTKTEHSIRYIPIVDFAMPYIKEHIARTRRAFFHGRILLPIDGKLPFCYTKFGARLTPNYADKKWKQMNDAEGWEHITLHKLRHTYATLCRDAGVPIETIADLLGHADTQITRQLYAHKTFKQIDDAAAKLDVLFNENKKSG